MIFSVNGNIGHGKGCVMTMFAKRQADKGRTVYTNWPIYDSRILYITTWAEVCDLDNCDVFIDECHNWFPARDWAKLGKPEDMLRWAQSRHDGINIYWCSQNPSQVDVQIREVYTHFVYHVRRIAGPDSEGDPSRIERLIGAWAVINKYDAAHYRLATKRESLWRRWINLQTMWGTYDTHHVIGFRDGTGVRAGRGRLPTTGGSPTDDRTLTAAKYEEGRWSDPHHPGIVRWFPEIGDAIRKKGGERGQSVGEVQRRSDALGGNGRRVLASDPAHEAHGNHVGSTHSGGSSWRPVTRIERPS